MDTLFSDLVTLKNENKELVKNNSEITSSSLIIRENYKMMENLVAQKDEIIKNTIAEKNKHKSD